MIRHSIGFTLVELVVCLAILAALLVGALPSLALLRDAAAAHGTLHALTASVASARIAAVTRRHPVTVCPSADGRHCRSDLRWDDGWIVYADRTRGDQPANDADILRHEQPSAGLAIRSTLGRHRIRFQANGLAGGNNLTLRVCERQSGRAVGELVVNLGGRARIARAPQGAPCPFLP
jgi:type IV fimbrial biogenesis protein FimT